MSTIEITAQDTTDRSGTRRAIYLCSEAPDFAGYALLDDCERVESTEGLPAELVDDLTVIAEQVARYPRYARMHTYHLTDGQIVSGEVVR